MELISSRSDLKKHIGTVQISNPLTLSQRKAFSVLLFNAYHDLEGADGKIHAIPMKAFCDLLGYNSNDHEALDLQIEKLQKTTISWIANPDEFERVTFFSYTAMKDGHYYYRFDPELEKKLYHPDVYAQINMVALSLFESRYALALYENLARYRPNKKSGFSGGSPQWSLEEFKELMGVSNIPSYQAFKELNRSVITPSITEINTVSDLLVTVQKIKKGRSIVALKFGVKDNPQQPLALIPEPKRAENEVKNALVQEMNELYGVPLLMGAEWLLQHGEDRFKQVLDLTGEAVEGGKVKSPVGFITKAFTEGWVSGTSAEEARENLKKLNKDKKKKISEKKKALSEARKKEKELVEKKEKSTLLNELEKLSDAKRVKVFEDFYDDSVGDWMGRFPLDKGQDPRNCENHQVQNWFIDFLRKAHS